LKPVDIIDLSHNLSASISVYPGSEKPVINTVAVLEQHGYREKQLILSTHQGTHIDCPSHLIREGFHTANAPISNFFGKARVIDCRNCSSDETITIESLHSQESEIARVDFLLFYTGMDKHWNTQLYYGIFPTLAQESAEYLTGFTLKGIGIDTLSVDPVGDTLLQIHKTLLSKNMIIIENLTGLESLIGKEFWFSCLPLKIDEGDGSPVRACALSGYFNLPGSTDLQGL